MKKTLLMGLMIGLISLGFGSSQAEAKTILDDFLGGKGVELEVSASVDVYDKYIWRGFKLDGDTVIQPAFTVSLAGFEGGFQDGDGGYPGAED